MSSHGTEGITAEVSGRSGALPVVPRNEGRTLIGSGPRCVWRWICPWLRDATSGGGPGSGYSSTADVSTSVTASASGAASSATSSGAW
jgi:hypothetical protein